MIAGSEDGDFAEALKLVDQALALLPGQPEIHDTRGKLLVKLGEPLKALAEFELALREPAIRSEVNRNMAEAWRALGNHQKALECQQVAEALQQAEARK
jgi:tetratricopeptide (TPR) repeat protein